MRAAESAHNDGTCVPERASQYLATEVSQIAGSRTRDPCLRSDERDVACDTWMRVADSEALRSAPKRSAELPIPRSAIPKAAPLGHGDPRGVSFTVAPRHRHAGARG